MAYVFAWIHLGIVGFNNEKKTPKKPKTRKQSYERSLSLSLSLVGICLSYIHFITITNEFKAIIRENETVSSSCFPKSHAFLPLLAFFTLLLPRSENPEKNSRKSESLQKCNQASQVEPELAVYLISTPAGDPSPSPQP